jgi:hypothetical protein
MQTTKTVYFLERRTLSILKMILEFGAFNPSGQADWVQQTPNFPSFSCVIDLAADAAIFLPTSTQI